MSVQRVRPLKLESLAEGGGQEDAAFGPTETNIGEDYLDAAGLCVQVLGANRNTADAQVRIERTATGALHFADAIANGATGLDLAQLVSSVSGSANAFNALQDIRLWIDGPGDGFAPGAVRVRLGTQPNSGGYVWYRAAGSTARLFDCTITYAAQSILPASKVYRLYAADGATVVRVVTDTFSWNGPLLIQTTRSWS
jgi:hypothetical protein